MSVFVCHWNWNTRCMTRTCTAAYAGMSKENISSIFHLFALSMELQFHVSHNTHTHTTVLQLFGFCLGQPEWAGTRWNIHPLTPIVVIKHPYPTKQKTFFQIKKNRCKEVMMHFKWSQGSAHYLDQKHNITHIRSMHTHTQPFYGPLGFCPELPGWAGTRKIKPGR